jgi:cytochrome c oxidase subunit 1
MHQLGLAGMPRRVNTYAADTGWGGLNLLASSGSVLLALALLLYAWNVMHALRRGRPAADDPWGGDTLEWSVPSPPPPYNFAVLPVVGAREPLWDPHGYAFAVRGLACDRREVLVTYVIDAAPDHRYEQPAPTLWPLAVAVATAVAFIGAIFTPWAIVAGGALVFPALIGWFWPKEHEE